MTKTSGLIIRHRLSGGGYPTFAVACSTARNKWVLPSTPEEPLADFDEVAELLEKEGGRVTYRINPSRFNTEVLKPTDFSEPFWIEDSKIRFAKSVFADGVVLEHSGDASVIIARGCPIIVATLDDKVAYAHAGRDCLFDRQYIISDHSDYERSSVVTNLLDTLDPFKARRSEIQIWVFFSIKPEQFEHDLEDPAHGTYNRWLLEYLKQREYPKSGWCVKSDSENNSRLHLNLPEIIREQCIQCEVSNDQIHIGSHSFLPDSLPTTREGEGNYLIVIVRK